MEIFLVDRRGRVGGLWPGDFEGLLASVALLAQIWEALWEPPGLPSSAGRLPHLSGALKRPLLQPSVLQKIGCAAAALTVLFFFLAADWNCLTVAPALRRPFVSILQTKLF